MNGVLLSQEKGLGRLWIAKHIMVYTIYQHFIQGVDHVFVRSFHPWFDEYDQFVLVDCPSIKLRLFLPYYISQAC